MQQRKPQQKPRGLLSGLTDGLSSPLSQLGLNIFASSTDGDGIGHGIRNGMQGIQQAEQNQMQQQQGQLRNKLLLAQIANSQRGPAPTAQMREYSLSKTDPGFVKYQTQLKQAGRPQTNVNVGAGETAYDKELGKTLAGEFVKAQSSSATARRDLANLSVMEQSINNPELYTGTGANQIHGLKKAAKSLFGIDVGGVADGEVVDRLTKKMALSLKDDLPGPMSDGDRKFLESLPPGLTTSAEGARRLLTLGIQHKNWKIERAAEIRRYAAKNGGRLNGGVYEGLAEVDQKYGQQMSGIMVELRQQPQAQQRTPSAGLPAGFSIKRVD